MENKKIIIIGAGPSGITASIYLKRAGYIPYLIESSMPGGKLSLTYKIENYPGFVSVSGSDLSNMLLEQVQSSDIDIIYDEVSSIDYDKKIITISNTKYSYKYLVFATGRREKLLELPNEDKLIGRGISLCATCDGALYRNQDVIVVGGGSSAVSEAIYLSNICNKVYLIYRGTELRAEEVLKSRLNLISNIEVIYEALVTDYLILEDKLSGVLLNNGNKIMASCVFLAIGQLPNSELFIGNKFNDYIVVDEYGKTSIDNVYACGDVIKKNVYQLVTASSEGVLVASSIINSEQSS